MVGEGKEVKQYSNEEFTRRNASVLELSESIIISRGITIVFLLLIITIFSLLFKGENHLVNIAE